MISSFELSISTNTNPSRMSKIKNPKNIFVKLITFGNTFNSKTFFDNFKKYFIEFWL